MNIFKKMYCRIFQTGFYIALPILPYREPKIYDSVEEIPNVLIEKEINSVLLVTDKSIRGLGLTKKIEKCLSDNNIKCYVYDDTMPNPTVNNVEDARSLYVANNCKAIIAFGGGSSMDCAKAVGARIARPNKSLKQLKGLLKVGKKIPLLVAIPTTAGTGSEVTVASVITDSINHHKYTILAFNLIPEAAVLDPECTRTLSPSLTSTTGMDALTHSVEAYIGRSTTKETREKAIKAIKLIFENIEKAYFDGNDLDARRKMLDASYLAGVAFSKSYVGYVHAIAHSLGGQYNIPHGFANAVILPIVLKAYGKSVYKKLHHLAVSVGISNINDNIEISANKFIDAIFSLNKKMNIPTTIKEIKEEDIDVMCEYAEKEANPLYPVPKLFDKKELKKLYFEIKGK